MVVCAAVGRSQLGGEPMGQEDATVLGTVHHTSEYSTSFNFNSHVLGVLKM